MNQIELLAYADSNFPVGTKFICCNSNQEAVITTGIFRIFRINQTGTGINEVTVKGQLIQTNKDFHCVYSDGRWAKITHVPEDSVKPTTVAEKSWFEIVLSLLGDTPNSFHSETFKTYEEAVTAWEVNYRDRNKNDGHDAYWNNIPMRIQKTTKKSERYW